MTWFASQIYAKPTKKAIEVLSLHPVLSKGLYLLKGKIDHNWPDHRVKHSFPPKGLLVVREVCNPGQCKNPHGGIEVEWHGENAISWEGLEGPDNLEVILPEDLPYCEMNSFVTYKLTPSYPPKSFLRFLKYLNVLTHSTITYYHRETYAGWQSEQEFAWVFDDEDHVFVSSEPGVLQYTSHDISYHELIDYADVLRPVLKQYGLILRTDYFAPHTRGFDWNRYKFRSEAGFISHIFGLRP